MWDALTDVGGWKVAAEDFLAAVLQTTAQPVWVVDADGLIRFANPAAIAALGYDSADELFGRPSHETIHHHHPDGAPYPAAECPMLLPRTTGETISRDLDWFFRRDGSIFPVSYVSVPLDVPGGRGAVVAFTDITDRLRAEHELLERDAILADEQAALRRVAAVVAGGSDAAEVFAAVTQEVGRALGLPYVDMLRYEPDGTATVIGAWGEREHPFEVGSRWALDGPTITARVRATGAPARTDDYTDISGTFADTVRRAGIRAAAGAPIVVHGALWGVIVTASDASRPLPDRIEQRLAGFTELVATALSHTQAREELQRLAEEQSALRRVATLVAQGAPLSDVFTAVAREVGRLLGITRVVMCRFEADDSATAIGAAGDHPFRPGTNWPLDGPSMMGTVRRTGRPARIDDYSRLPGRVADAVRGITANAGVTAPIIVDGEVWGTVSVGADSALPPDTEDRLSQFTDLVATAISRTQAREELRRLADEQSALRRVATLVAQGRPPAEVFAAVADQVSRVLGLPLTTVARVGSDHVATIVGAAGDHPHAPGLQYVIEGPSASAMVLETGRPARLDGAREIEGEVAGVRGVLTVGGTAAAPIIVNGRTWGIIASGVPLGQELPAGVEHRLTEFTPLVATAISNTQAREDLQRLADEQAALRRLATLVAQDVEPREVFDAVAEETGRLLGATTVNLCEFTADGMNITRSGWSLRDVHVKPGTRLPIDGDSINAIVRRTARPGRCDNYEQVGGRLAAHLRSLGIRSEVGAPVVAEGRVWGALIAGTDEPDPLPVGAEHRLAEFAELIATAVANATARSELVASRARIVQAADEQRRRVVRDLHDGAQQRLVHALMTLQLAAGRGDAPSEVHAALEDTRAAIEELRELAHGLHPAILTHHGLAAAVEALADRAPLPVTVDIAEERYPAPVESAAYFVAAEALTNVAKYARADAATVNATCADDRLVLVIADDGVGGAVAAAGSGLAGLEDRVAALGGTLAVDSPPEAGTTIRAEIPLA